MEEGGRENMEEGGRENMGRVFIIGLMYKDNLITLFHKVVIYPFKNIFQHFKHMDEPYFFEGYPYIISLHT